MLKKLMILVVGLSLMAFAAEDPVAAIKKNDIQYVILNNDDLMEEYGAVNAGNMDGGASSVMYYQGEQNTIVSTLYGARNMPDCWLVAPES